jgi:hypothetical protein
VVPEVLPGLYQVTVDAKAFDPVPMANGRPGPKSSILVCDTIYEEVQ